jgi:hypothetical protein
MLKERKRTTVKKNVRDSNHTCMDREETSDAYIHTHQSKTNISTLVHLKTQPGHSDMA